MRHLNGWFLILTGASKLVYYRKGQSLEDAFFAPAPRSAGARICLNFHPLDAFLRRAWQRKLMHLYLASDGKKLRSDSVTGTARRRRACINETRYLRRVKNEVIQV